MFKFVIWMNNQWVGELMKLVNGVYIFKYVLEWLVSCYVRLLLFSLLLQRGNIIFDVVFNFFDNLLFDSSIVCDWIVKCYYVKFR